MNAFLFTTTSCPKCPSFKEFVSQNISFPVEIFENTHPEFAKKIQLHEVSAAPTIIIFDENNNEIFRTSDEGELFVWTKGDSGVL